MRTPGALTGCRSDPSLSDNVASAAPARARALPVWLNASALRTPGALTGCRPDRSLPDNVASAEPARARALPVWLDAVQAGETFSKTTTTMDEDDFFFLSLMYIYWKKSHTSRHSRYTEQSKYARTLFDQSSLIKVNTACAIMYVSKTIYEVARKLY